MMESSRKQGTSSPCAACKFLRRRCAQDCVFAPYFPADEPQKFANVHKVFGASNVNKMLQELPVHQRGDAVSSMVYEANARVRDPVYGCVGTISSLQHQIDVLQTQFALAQAEVVHMHMRQVGTSVSGLAGNWLGSSLSDEHVAYRFKMLGREVAISTDRSYLSDMFWAVSRYCRTKWDECKESLKRYWWSIFLFAATFILLVLTFRQTIFTVHRHFHLPL